MPRIDPLQLLNCLSVLLRPDGGIRSESEVLRLASLMTKFSKKLVSKCIYVQILKRSETRLLELFMASGGWSLIHLWLSDGISSMNWALVQELLELLLLSPVDVEILKSNNCPKLVKGLSRDENQEGVRLLAGKLVEQWLRLVKGESLNSSERIEDQKVSNIELECNKLLENSISPQNMDQQNSEINSTTTIPAFNPSPVENNERIDKVEKNEKIEKTEKTEKIDKIEESVVEPNACLNKPEETANEQVLSATNKLKNESEITSNTEVVGDTKDDVINKNKIKKDKRHSVRSSDLKSTSKSPSSKHSSSKSSSRESSSRHSKSKDRDRDKKSSSKSSRSRDKEKYHDREKEKEIEKTKQEEKDKATLDELKPKTLSKLGKIPKKTNVSNEEKTVKTEVKNSKDDHQTKGDEKTNKIEPKKASISIEVRKNEGNRPKTVKTFNSKFRSHGLEEEAKPPPPRVAKKTTSNVPVPVKRQSPPRYDIIAPEKKPKTIETTVQTKPGAIKLIPAKPKPSLLMESDMFMDALSASASTKKETRKRKRKLSVSKDSESEIASPVKIASPSHGQKADVSPDSKLSTQEVNEESKTEAIPAAPPRFYQDTLENTDEEQETDAEKDLDQSSAALSEQPEEASPEISEAENNTQIEKSNSEPMTRLKSVLLNSKRKGPKKKLQWRNEEELVDIQYFELDETERVNVTKTFTDMKNMERVNEREAFQLARKLPNEDTMEERTSWMILIPVDGVAVINFGKNSREKDIQYARERIVAPTVYYHRMMIPDSPAEPDPELYSVTDPTIIPLDDVTGNSDTINDFQNTPWPEPKGIAPPPVIVPPAASFPTVPPMLPFPNGPGLPFSMPSFPGHPGHSPFPMRGPNPDSLSPVPPDMMMSGGMFPTRMDGSIDNNMMPVNGFGTPFGPSFAGHNPNGFPGPRPMRPMGGMAGVRGPIQNSGWYRAPGSCGPIGPNGPPGPPAWQNGPRKNWNPRICRQFFRKGFCNKGDNCLYLHPGVNCPPL